MTASRPAPANTAEVDAFMAALEHPLKPAVQALRALILAADAGIDEGIKWNAPSFRTVEWFATFHLRKPGEVQLVLHFGAKVSATSASGVSIADPDGLLAWRGKDRAIVSFASASEVAARAAALTAILRQWVVHVR